MKIVRALLVCVALVLSALPVLWMSILTFAQYGNLWLKPPYWHEFASIVAFWIGFAAALVFARRCFTRRLSSTNLLVLLTLVVVGVAGGISEEILLWNNAKTSFPIGYFELATLSWIVVGLIARKLPNPPLNTDARGQAARAG